jgi:hypothetical protein
MGDERRPKPSIYLLLSQYQNVYCVTFLSTGAQDDLVLGRYECKSVHMRGNENAPLTGGRD